MKRRPLYPEGAILGDANEGRLWRVVRIRWWQVGRWLEWVVSDKIRGVLHINVRDGNAFRVERVRVIEADDIRLPNVPRPFESAGTYAVPKNDRRLQG